MQAKHSSELFLSALLLAFRRALAGRDHQDQGQTQIGVERLPLNHHSDINNRNDFAK
jgi:hypothetical protein